MRRMHRHEVDIPLNVVQELIQAQFPYLAKFPIMPIDSSGTVNAIYKLGQEFAIRLPRMKDWSKDIEKEWTWLPRLAPSLSLKIPEPVVLGKPTASYPFGWAIYKWITGENYTDTRIHAEEDAARALAEFVTELHSIAVPDDAPAAGRRPLAELDRITTDGIEASGDVLDKARTLAAWQHSRNASAWNGQSVWIHADLLRTNLIVASGRLAAIIDFGSA